MDGENNGKPYFSMDDLGGKPTIFGNIFVAYCFFKQPPMFEGIHKIQFLWVAEDFATKDFGIGHTKQIEK